MLRLSRSARWPLALLSLCGAFAPLLLAQVPAPESHFGHAMGADRRLVEWASVVSYFDKLERGSKRVRVSRYGKSVDGRPLIAAFISSPETLAQLERYRDIQARLADPRRTTPAEAETLISQGKTVVMVTCSIHSTEVASTFSAVEFAHQLATSSSPKVRAILDQTILILVPSLNPDGVDIVTDWYRRTLGTPYEGTGPPELYHRYLGHDNNRDWYIFSQPETCATISQLHNVWHPQIVYDVHQQGAYASRMFLPPWLDPIEPNIDPILAQLANSIGSTIASDLTIAGKKGVVINAIYDAWTPARQYQAYHGGLRILSEAASARLATPITIKPEEIAATASGYNPRESSWNYPEPWLGGEWRVRDIVDYQLITMESCLHQAATRREQLLRGFYQIGKRAIGRTSPVAFVVSSQQRDPEATRILLDTLSFGAVEIHRAQRAFQAGGNAYPAGTHIIWMQQPYSSFAKTLLEVQEYPDLRMFAGGPPRRPYDVTAHTLPLLMGVKVETINQPFDVEAVRTAVFTPEPSPSRDRLPASDTRSWQDVNRAWSQNVPVSRDPSTGDFYVGRPNPALPQVARPRIGLYNSFVPNMDEGWTRWMFDRFGFTYTRIENKDLQTANLRDRFDVIVFPDQRAASMFSGHQKGAMPDEFTGGVGEAGVAALKQFLASGGRAIFLNDAVEFALANLDLGVRNSLAGVSNRDFYSPGSLLNVRLDGHPITRGLPSQIPVWFENSPALEIPQGSAARAIATYPEDNVLASGWLIGDRRLRGRAAVVDVPVGSGGHAILFAMRPQYRAQSYLTLKLFFNALLPITGLPTPAPSTQR